MQTSTPDSSLSSFSKSLAAVVRAVERGAVWLDCRRAPTTGVVWDAAGLVITAQHAVESEEVGFGLPDGTTGRAKLLGRGGGIALFELEGPKLEPLAWGNRENISAGELALQVAREARGLRVALGVVSSVRKSVRLPNGRELGVWVETDARVYPGFSGSLHVNAEGELVGMNHAGLVRGRALSLGRAELEPLVQSLRQHGRLRRAYLGVGAQPARLPDAIAQGEGQPSGLLLASVEPGGPAAGAGLLLGDVLLSLSGTPLTTLADLLAELGEERIDQKLEARVLRAGRVETFSVSVGARP